MAVACDKSPTQPSPPQTQPPATPTTIRLALDGPPTIPPGGTAQFTATATLSDGSTRDVTTIAGWQLSSTRVATIVAGLATGRDRGDLTITARYNGLSSVKTVMVIPNGTFRLSGVVMETVPPVGPIPAVRIEVADGPERGLSTTSSFDGSFRLYGVAGSVGLLVSKPGYSTRTEQVNVTGHQSQQLGLTILTPLPDLSGRYTMTVQAADECDALPPDARRRTYTAEVVQAGPRARITLSGATFPTIYFGLSNTFEGTVEPTQARWLLLNADFYYYYGPSLLEQIAPTQFLIAHGTLTTGNDRNRFGGELDGTMEVRDGTQVGRLRSGASCKSARHTVTLTR